MIIPQAGKSVSFRCVVSAVLITFLTSFISPVRSFAQSPADLGLPVPGAMISLTPNYVPLLVKGLRVHPENPILFDFIVDTGNSNLTANNTQLKTESEKLIKYFLASLTIPEENLWVNLSPYEKDRVIPNELGQTEMGRDMLAQDYMLKQLTASLIYPEKDLGKEFWNKVYAKAQALYGSSEIPVNTFNKVWIVADQAKVYVHDNTAFVVGAHLKVMLESDYLAMEKNNRRGLIHQTQDKGMINHAPTETNQLGSQIVRDIVLPELEREVNQGKTFSNLRQIFHSMILAAWYKKNLKDSLLNQVYSNKAKINGVDTQDKTIKEQIYQEYLKAYKKGVFNYIKEDPSTNAQGKQVKVARKYFSGGEIFTSVFKGVQQTSDPADAATIATVGNLYNVGVTTPKVEDQAMMADSNEGELTTAIKNGKFLEGTNKLRLANVSKIEGLLGESAKKALREDKNQNHIFNSQGFKINSRQALTDFDNDLSVVYVVKYKDGSINLVFIADISGGEGESRVRLPNTNPPPSLEADIPLANEDSEGEIRLVGSKAQGNRELVTAKGRADRAMMNVESLTYPLGDTIHRVVFDPEATLEEGEIFTERYTSRGIPNLADRGFWHTQQHPTVAPGVTRELVFFDGILTSMRKTPGREIFDQAKQKHGAQAISIEGEINQEAKGVLQELQALRATGLKIKDLRARTESLIQQIKEAPNAGVRQSLREEVRRDPLVRYYKLIGSLLNQYGDAPIISREIMSIVYSPFVGTISKLIDADPELYTELGTPKEFENPDLYVISDGSALLGYGNMGADPMAAVAKGKAALILHFGGVKSNVALVDNFKLWEEWKKAAKAKDQTRMTELEQQIADRVVAKALEIRKKHPHVGFMMEDIARPLSIILERKLNELGIPTMHDDQHGTAIIVGTGVLRALKKAGFDITSRESLKKATVVIQGAGASGYAVANNLHALGLGNIIVLNSKGAIYRGMKDFNLLHPAEQKLADFYTGNIEDLKLREDENMDPQSPDRGKYMKRLLRNANGYVGLAVPKLYDGMEDDILSGMAKGAFVFALANPDGEFNDVTLSQMVQKGEIGSAGIGAFKGTPFVDTLNNSSAFPGWLRGLSEAIKDGLVPQGMNEETIVSARMAATQALASIPLTDAEIAQGKLVVPSFIETGYDTRLTAAVSKAVYSDLLKRAQRQGINTSKADLSKFDELATALSTTNSAFVTSLPSDVQKLIRFDFNKQDQAMNALEPNAELRNILSAKVLSVKSELEPWITAYMAAKAAGNKEEMKRLEGGNVQRKLFSSLSLDEDRLIKDLADKGYINKDAAIQDKFRMITASSQMDLDPVFVEKRDQIFSIIQKADEGINKIVDHLNVYAQSPASDLTLSDDVKSLSEFLKSDSADSFRQKARELFLKANYIPQFIFAGAATRLNRGPMYHLDIWDIAVELGKAKNADAKSHLGMGPRQIIAYRKALEDLIKESGLDLKTVLSQQKIIINVNGDIEQDVLDDLVKNNFYGFNRHNVFIVVQPTFRGYQLNNGEIKFDAQSPTVPYGHGHNFMQLAEGKQAFIIDEEGKREYVEGRLVDQFTDDQVIVSHRINDLTKLSKSSVISVDKVAFALAQLEEGADVVGELVNNPNKQKGGNGLKNAKKRKSFLIETSNVKASPELIALLDEAGKRGAPFNAFRLIYKVKSLKRILNQKLPFNVRFKDGFFYLEAVTGDVTQMDSTNARFMSSGEDIHDFKEPKNIDDALKFLKESDDQLDQPMTIKTLALKAISAIRAIVFGTSGDRWVEQTWQEQGIDSADHINRIGTGIAHVFNQNTPGQIMLVGFDPRQRNRESAEALASLYAANGIKVFIINLESTPTPVLALMANRNPKIGGVTILTASHSPWTDRGIKFSPAHGGAAPSVMTDQIQAFANQATEYKTTDYEQAKAQGQIVEISPEEAQKIYVDEYVVPKLKELGAWDDIVNFIKANPKFEMVLDPMQGTGVRYLKAIYEALAQAAGRNFYTMINTDNTDIKFSKVNGAPNPTLPASRKAFEEAIRAKIAEGKKVMGASVDTDSDRFGNIDSNGEFVSTNDMIALLAYFLKKEIGLDGAIGKTVATSNFANAIAKFLGVEIDEERVGFKYFVDNVVSKGRKYLIAGEERSHVAVGPFMESWDDGFVVGLMGLWITAKTGKSLTEYKDEIQKVLDQKFKIETITIRGKDDSVKNSINTKIQLAKDELKAGKALNELSIVQEIEAAQGQKVVDIITKDGVKLVLESGDWILMRPSGTEPAVKLYVEVVGNYAASNDQMKLKFDELVAVGRTVIGADAAMSNTAVIEKSATIGEGAWEVTVSQKTEGSDARVVRVKENGKPGIKFDIPNSKYNNDATASWLARMLVDEAKRNSPVTLTYSLIKDVVNSVVKDNAMRGGIDLNSKNMQMNVNGDKIDIRWDPAMIAQFKAGNFTGVQPVIINITPIVNVRMFLGLAPIREEELAKV